MNTPDKEKFEMNTTPTTNQRLVTILLVLLIVLVVLLIIGIIVGFLMMSGMTLAPGAHLPRAQVPWSAGVGRWMMGWASITLAPDASAGVTNNMARACLDMMQNFQGPGNLV